MAIEDGFILEGSRYAGRRSPPVLERARAERTRRAVEGSADNITRFHNRALADPAKAREYVEREWAGANVASRYEWLFPTMSLRRRSDLSAGDRS
jgi:salicylate hydroxylase